MGKVVPFDKVIELFEEYKKEYGDLLVPQKYVTANGINLGIVVSKIRTGRRKTTVEEKKRLDEIGFVWNCHVSFAEVIELLEEYKNEHSDLLVPYRYCTADGIKLGSIVSNIRTGARKTTAEQKAKLAEIGFVWKVR